MIRGGEVLVPEHLSKAQDIALKPGDRVRVRTPGAAAMAHRNSAIRRWWTRMCGWDDIRRKRRRGCGRGGATRWARWINERELADFGCMDRVWKAYGFHTYASRTKAC